MPAKLNHYFFGITLKDGRHEIVMDWLTPKELDAFLYKLRYVRIEFMSKINRPPLILHPEDIANINIRILETHYYEEDKIPNKENEMTETHTIPVGTIVKLKSGGPKMTVVKHFESKEEGMKIECNWFSEGSLASGWFGPASLEIVGDEFKEISAINQGVPDAKVEETELQETT